MSRRRRRQTPSITSYVGLIRFYEEVEEQVKIPPYLILLITYITALTILILRIFLKP
ncbi:MAG: preprotein translocase subunit Sec61beta [Desulfurococcaceae archaeon]|jgi:preprotein translocase subunit Sec61beta|nr:preprotein translocase subunit Sec61beta [Desulfurococcaceae archaeon]MCC6058175.1 preprotein translocase subunit Sec61beta [Desulfurococcaceae archaeon]